MNQSLVLFYEKCNCIRIMSLNTYDKNVDTLYNMTLLHHIPNYATWFLKTIRSHKYEERGIEVYDKQVMICHFSYHMPHQPLTHISPRAEGPWANMGVSGCIHANPRETESGRGSRVCHPHSRIFFSEGHKMVHSVAFWI